MIARSSGASGAGGGPVGGVGADGLLEQAAIALLIILAVAGTVCWLGAQAAAVVSGHGLVPIGIADGASALGELPHHWSDPANAWPADIRGDLPGPWIYWIANGLVGGVVVIAGASVTRQVLRRRSSEPHSLGIRANAGLANRSDLRPLRVRRPTAGRLTLGFLGHQLVAAEPQVSLAVVGPTGCGKTAGFAIPALLEWEGPIIATSVKADLLAATLVHRQQRGRVWIYDPTGAAGPPQQPWSPLTACTTWAGALRIAAWLCEAAQPKTDTVTDGDYWYSQARRALGPYLHAAALDGRTMRDVVRWIDREEIDEVEAILRRHGGVEGALIRLLDADESMRRRDQLRPQVQDEEVDFVRRRLRDLGGGSPSSWEMRPVDQWPDDQQAQLAERVEQALEDTLVGELQADAFELCQRSGALDPLITAQSLWDKEQRLRGSIFATVENVLAGYANPGVTSGGGANELDVDEWLSGDNTIFVVAPAHEQARLRPVLTVLVQQAVRAAYDTANRDGGQLPSPCLVLLDEAGNIAPLKDLPGYASTARSHGITLVSIWQDLAQIKSIYGEQGRTVLNNHQAKLFGTGIADQDTLDYLSRMIGDQRRTDVNLSGDLYGGRRSMSEHVSYRRTAPADLLRRMRLNEGILVYGTHLPARIRLRPWYQHHRRLVATTKR